MRTLPLWLALAAFVQPPDASAGADCPTNTFALASAPAPWTESTLDTTVSTNGVVIARAAYDLVAGTLAVLHPASLAPTYVHVGDLFDVTGVAPGTVVNLVAELAASGTISTSGCGGSGCSGYLRATITANGQSSTEMASRTVFAAATVPISVVTVQPIALVAGTPTLVEFELRGGRSPGGNHRVDGTGAYRFLGLPKGAGLVSCRGFTGAPTPAAPATWGRVKAGYR